MLRLWRAAIVDGKHVRVLGAGGCVLVSMLCPFAHHVDTGSSPFPPPPLTAGCRRWRRYTSASWRPTPPCAASRGRKTRRTPPTPPVTCRHTGAPPGLPRRHHHGTLVVREGESRAHLRVEERVDAALIAVCPCVYFQPAGQFEGRQSQQEAADGSAGGGIESQGVEVGMYYK